MSNYISQTDPSALHPAAPQTFPSSTKFIAGDPSYGGPGRYMADPTTASGSGGDADEDTTFWEDVIKVGNDAADAVKIATGVGKEIDERFYGGSTPGTVPGAGGAPSGSYSPTAYGGPEPETDYTWYYVGGGALALLAIWYFMK